MKFNFSKDMLSSLLKGNKEVDAWYESMIKVLPKYEIDTPKRVAGFIAQCAHESNNFSVMSENLNYSAEGLMKIFPKYFNGRDPNAYARKPEEIANIVYANRMGNGSEKSGDGWKFRGRGIIQLTGHDNYSAFAKAVGMDIDSVIKYVESKEGALESACWYWNSRKINDAADAGDIVKMTKLINGGTIGLDDRKKHYDHALEVLDPKAVKTAAKPVEAPKPVTPPKNEKSVKDIQAALGLTADGILGPQTKAAIIEFQKNNNLTPDGVAGPMTLKALFGE